MGTPAKVELRTSAKLKPPLYLNARTNGATVRTRLVHITRIRWRGTLTLTKPGPWTLHAGGASATVSVLPPPASTFAPPGAAGCAPPSPANALTREALGTNGLWALFGALADAHTAVIDAAVGKQTKIVWRFGGSGNATFTAVAPDGTQVAPTSLEPHAGSNWMRPGDEWGSLFVFTQPGCWQIHAARTDNAGDLWLLVRS
jgi:hypothetical protein